MSFECIILKDSVSSTTGKRLTTFQITFPRSILAEVNTHRMLSKSSASSRAIPVDKMIARVVNNPYIPTHWGKAQKGMQAYEEVSGEVIELAKGEWLMARDDAVNAAQRLLKLGLHKQVINRLLEPFMWHTIIISGTEWSNFFNLRDHPAAHPELRKIAHLMKVAYLNNTPVTLNVGEWHMPLLFDEDNDLPLEKKVKVSVGRCARVSYLTHDGRRDIEADITLCDTLVKDGHCTPGEHVATPTQTNEVIGNFIGWLQYRKTIPYEYDVLGHGTISATIE